MIQALLLDAHSGKPVPEAQLSLEGKSPAARPGEDGIVILHDVPEGSHPVRVVALGYYAIRDTVALTATEGRVRIYQLKRVGFCLTETVSVEPARH